MSATPLSEWQLLFDTITKKVHAMGFRNGGIAGEKIRVTSPIRKFESHSYSTDSGSFEGVAFTTFSGNQYVLSGDETQDWMMVANAVWGFWDDLLDGDAGIDGVKLLEIVRPISLDDAARLLLVTKSSTGWVQ